MEGIAEGLGNRGGRGEEVSETSNRDGAAIGGVGMPDTNDRSDDVVGETVVDEGGDEEAGSKKGREATRIEAR